MRTTVDFVLLACGTLIGGLLVASPSIAAEHQHDIETLKKLREVCMEQVGVPPFCACAENAVKQNIPSGAIQLNAAQELEIIDGTSKDVYNAVNAAVADCGQKFAPDQWHEEGAKS